LARGTHMRQTLHTVHVADYPAVHGAMHRRLHGGRLGDPRFQATGLKAKDVLDVLPELLDYLAEPRSKDEIDDWLGERLGTRHERTWWALRTFAPVWHVPNGGAWAVGRPRGGAGDRGGGCGRSPRWGTGRTVEPGRSVAGTASARRRCRGSSRGRRPRG